VFASQLRPTLELLFRMVLVPLGLELRVDDERNIDRLVAACAPSFTGDDEPCSTTR
jgi:hypothetical protein